MKHIANQKIPKI